MKVFPVGIHRQAKEKILELIPKNKQEIARKLLRTAEENAVIFARISRSPGSFDEISSSVDEEGAARFHQKWTVSIEGYGHKSVGEHAILQIAIEDVASADGDAITDNRLASYTEFSARFKSRQGKGYFTPQSVLKDKALTKLWRKTHQLLFKTCDRLTSKAEEWIFSDEAQNQFKELRQGYYHSEETEKAWLSRLTKHAADQYKNLLPASRLTSIGVTMNASEGEHAIKKFLSGPSPSLRKIGRAFKRAALEIAPTLVKYANFDPYLASWPTRRNLLIKEFNLKGKLDKIKGETAARTEIVQSKKIEALILAAFIFEDEKTGTFKDLVSKINHFPKTKRQKMIQRILKENLLFNDFEKGKINSAGIGAHDMPPRAFEFNGGYIYEFPQMTYGDWREFKRHRIQSYSAKPLDIKWGHMIPPLATIMDKSKNKKFHGCTKAVEQAVEQAERLFKKVAKNNPGDARYAVTRLHYRPAIAQFNTREAFHLIKLRTGDTAHAFIRRLMWPTYDLIKKKHPAIAEGIYLRGKRTKIAFP
ncbi:MAG: FAD-dependent thymidylate synthase [Candidatus Pacebacteria bacterium]|nr:FAD-dependent thymidylate synthase [Candidatus Paceibacterota bacterium]